MLWPIADGLSLTTLLWQWPVETTPSTSTHSWSSFKTWQPSELDGTHGCFFVPFPLCFTQRCISKMTEKPIESCYIRICTIIQTTCFKMGSNREEQELWALKTCHTVWKWPFGRWSIEVLGWSCIVNSTYSFYVQGCVFLSVHKYWVLNNLQIHEHCISFFNIHFFNLTLIISSEVQVVNSKFLPFAPVTVDTFLDISYRRWWNIAVRIAFSHRSIGEVKSSLHQLIRCYFMMSCLDDAVPLLYSLKLGGFILL